MGDFDDNLVEKKDKKTANNVAKASSSNNNSKTPNDNIKPTTTSRGGSTSSSDTRACAACKYQRRRCASDCVLAPYFPPDHQKQFLNAHRLFGLRNMMKVYKSVEPHQRDIAMRSMILEANIRANDDPVGGCHGVIQGLYKQIQVCKVELNLVIRQLNHFRNLSNAVGTQSNPTQPSIRFTHELSHADFCASLLGYKNEAVEAIEAISGGIDPAITSEDINRATSLLVDGSKDIGIDQEDMKPQQLIEANNLIMSRKADEQKDDPKGECKIPIKSKQEDLKEANSQNSHE